MSVDLERIANVADAEAVASLVNKAYRPEDGARGWTHESDLIAGQRTNARQVADAINRPDSFILLCLKGQEIVACVHVEKERTECHIGTLAVSPSLQSEGIGNRMLSQAEDFARMTFSSEIFTILVLSARPELISFYTKRGYQRTGAAMDYPFLAGVGIPKLRGLKVEVLKKRSNNAP